VKYFSNEEYEKKRYEDTLIKFMKSNQRSEISLAILNIGQGNLYFNFKFNQKKKVIFFF
jgi:ABC-type transport system involved in Fe-S cluster assembly fused permease/ATPase subunit